MNKLLSVIYLSIFFVFSSCAITMSGPFDGQSDSLPLVYKVNIEKSDLVNFVMLCEAVDGVDDTTLEEMRAASEPTPDTVEPDFYKDNFYLVFENTEYEAGIFIIEYADTGSFVKFMDVDLKTGIASNDNKSVSISSEFSSDYKTVTISMIRAGIEGFYVSTDKSFMFTKQSTSVPSKAFISVKTGVFLTKDNVNYELDGSKRISTEDAEFNSINYYPYAIFYFNQEDCPFGISRDLILLVFKSASSSGIGLYFVELDPADKFITIRNYPNVGENSVFSAKVASDYKNILINWEWLH